MGWSKSGRPSSGACAAYIRRFVSGLLKVISVVVDLDQPAHQAIGRQELVGSRPASLKRSVVIEDYEPAGNHVLIKGFERELYRLIEVAIGVKQPNGEGFHGTKRLFKAPANDGVAILGDAELL